ncbi:MAG: helix-turn-helix transcriptional regulator [Spirochaetes bacterium]|nr:helix-turn-helix transcriptional regulator [Spirochaetota bacterium]
MVRAVSPLPHPASPPFHAWRLSIDLVGRTWVDSSWNRRVFFWPYDRLYQFLSGRATAFLRGGGRLAMRPGRLYWLPAFMLAEIRCPVRSEHRFIHFRFAGGGERLWYGAARPALEAPIVEAPLMGALLAHVEKNWQSSRAEDTIACEAGLRFLLSPFFSGTSARLPELERFRPVLEWVEGHLDDPPSVGDLARIIGLDVDYFSVRFRKTLGVSPKSWILSRRLQKAAALLWDTPLKIREAAFACGWEDEAYFTRVFHQRMGCSPSAYRKRRKE